MSPRKHQSHKLASELLFVDIFPKTFKINFASTDGGKQNFRDLFNTLQYIRDECSFECVTHQNSAKTTFESANYRIISLDVLCKLQRSRHFHDGLEPKTRFILLKTINAQYFEKQTLILFEI